MAFDRAACARNADDSSNRGNIMTATMFRILFSAVLLGLWVGSETATAQSGLRDEKPPIAVEEIMEKFAAKESRFRIARANYVYRQSVKIQELDAGGRVRGEYELVSDIGFDPKGRRTERIVYAPQSSLRGIQITPQDLHDIREIQPFVLTAEDIHLYTLTYQGKEEIDEIDCYVFDVEPRRIEKGRALLRGSHLGG